jgi:hypothetical protein
MAENEPKLIQVASALPTTAGSAIILDPYRGARVEDIPAAPPRKQARRGRPKGSTNKRATGRKEANKKATGRPRGRPRKEEPRRGIYSSVMRAFGRGDVSKKESQKAVATRMREEKSNLVMLTFGQTVLAVGMGIAAGVALDAAVQRFASKSKMVRLGVVIATGVACWFIGGAAAMRVASRIGLGTALKLGAVASTMTGVIIVGVDYVNEKAKA